MPEGTVFSHTDRPSPVNNLFIFGFVSQLLSLNRLARRLLTICKNRYAMRTCVCYLEIIVGYVVLSYTVQNVGFVGFVWYHVCFAALKINETVGKKLKSVKDKVSGS